MPFARSLLHAARSFAACMLLAIALPAAATPATYTFSGTGTGDVNGTGFTNAAFTITLTGDTTAITGGPSIFQLTTAATIAIAGFPLATVTDSVGIFSNTGGPAVGFQRTAGLDLMDVSGAPFAGYQLATSLGPISGLTPFAVNQFNNLNSNQGPITFTDASNVTFQAVVGAAPPPVVVAQIPTLGAFALVLLALTLGTLGFAALRRRR